MAQHGRATEPAVTEQTWQEIEGVVEEIARLSSTDLSTREFFTELMGRTVRALTAIGGVVWLKAGADAPLQMEVHARSGADPWGPAGPTATAHLRLLENVLLDGHSRAVPPGYVSQDGQAANPTDSLLLACPITGPDGGAGVLELMPRDGMSPAAQRHCLQLLEGLAELASDHLRHQQLRRLQERQTMWGRFDQFVETVHTGLDLEATAYALANETRRFIGCDRVSVVLGGRRRCHVRAVSGADSVDRRSNAIACLERLTRAVLSVDEPHWFGAGDQQRPPQIEEPLHQYLDLSHVRSIAVVPLHAPARPSDAKQRSRPIGALVIERFDAEGDDAQDRERVAIAVRHGATALDKALVYRRATVVPLQRWLAALVWLIFSRRVFLVAAAALIIAAAVIALVMVPGEFTVSASGQLQPQVRHHLFAPADGIVERLHVDRQGADVYQGQPLLELTNAELDFERTRLLGERQTAQEQLSSVKSAILGASPTTRQEQDQFNLLEAREKELAQVCKSLDERLAVLERQAEQLIVKSPIDGQVLTWEIQQVLADRPVRRGQALLSVADPSGPWVVELEVPDRHIGYVLEAQRQRGEPLEVSLLLKNDPAVTHYGTIERVAMASETRTRREGSVLVTVQIDSQDIARLRPGAGVVAKIHCGPSSIGYVWLHDLIETIRTRVLF